MSQYRSNDDEKDASTSVAFAECGVQAVEYSGMSWQLVKAILMPDMDDSILGWIDVNFWGRKQSGRRLTGTVLEHRQVGTLFHKYLG
jgi:hypothetical protein